MSRTVLVALLVGLSSLAIACERSNEGASGYAADQSAPRSGGPGPAAEMAPTAVTSAPDAANAKMSADAVGRSAPPPAPPPSPDQTTSGTGSQPSVAPSMLIRTGTALVEVDSLEVAVAELRLLATGLGGFVANSSSQAGSERLRMATLDLKIPAARFEDALAGLRPIGKVESTDITTEDVGEEFVDVTARLSNARRLEDRLLGLLATRTGKLEDVLQVERELARVREEIERYEGRIRYLRSRAAVSTLTVTVHEPRPVVGQYPGANVIGDAFRAMWRNLVGFIAGFIAALGWLLPLALLVLGAWWAARRVVPRARGERRSARPPESGETPRQ